MAGLTDWTEWPLVKVIWHDAHANTTGWTHVEELDTDPAICISVGFWMPTDTKPDHVSLCQSTGPDGTVDHMLCIPTAMVKRISRLDERDAVDPTN